MGSIDSGVHNRDDNPLAGIPEGPSSLSVDGVQPPLERSKVFVRRIEGIADLQVRSGSLQIRLRDGIRGLSA